MPVLRALVALGLLIAGGSAFLISYLRSAPTPAATTLAPSPPAAPSPVASRPVVPPLAPVPDPVTFPVSGPRTYTTVGGTGPVVGSAGPLIRYRVLVEHGITGVDDFAGFVQSVYANGSGWTAGGKRRFQRVAGSADLVVYLVTPATRDALCRDGYDRYTSCRSGDKVILNVARWRDAVPAYGAPLVAYRQYMINHETGHWLGYGHELCPGVGEPAPVMQQQTLGRHGCTANPWPYVAGRPHHGDSGAYSDPVPPA